MHLRKEDTQVVPLGDRIQAWKCSLHSGQAASYVASVNRDYDDLSKHASSETLVELRLMRSYWAKQLLNDRLHPQFLQSCNSQEFEDTIQLLMQIRCFVTKQATELLVATNTRIGNDEIAVQLCELLADFGDPTSARNVIKEIDSSGKCLRRLGPTVNMMFRPIRKSRRSFDPTEWLRDKSMSEVEFIDEDPDHIRIRGIELRSGDLGIVELNHPGDGILESFLVDPGLAPHAMLYVTRRSRDAYNNIIFQPSLIEIYEGGWRSLPVTTGLSPHFSWYSQWVRPPDLPDAVGEMLSNALDSMETIAFDFQSRRVPRGGVFTPEFGNPSATCTNLIRIPFERSGIDWLPYETTPIAAGAQVNLAKIGIHIPDGIHTPTNILRSKEFSMVGIVDNGSPEWSLAQQLVNGRPEHIDTIGGMISQREVMLENLPNWRSIGNWRSACEAAKVSVAQSNGILGSLARTSFGYTKEAIPSSASDTTIAFYLRSEFVSSDIIRNVIQPALLQWLSQGGSSRLSDLRTESAFRSLLRDAIEKSALVRENWYGSRIIL
ncbi:MAG: hypothetical protein NTW52_10050 [Planctomycetota bacterium]|nr:hypothetical protein [Planctomycetota bacterium]